MAATTKTEVTDAIIDLIGGELAALNDYLSTSRTIRKASIGGAMGASFYLWVDDTRFLVTVSLPRA